MLVFLGHEEKFDPFAVNSSESGVICCRRPAARVKGEVYNVVLGPAMMCGFEVVQLTKRQVVELKTSRVSL